MRGKTAVYDRLLSVVVPCYNEEQTVERVLGTIEELAAQTRLSGIDIEVVAIDDASRDGTAEKLREYSAAATVSITVLGHPQNRGKGAAIRTAREHVQGDVVIIQDADLEYDPFDIPRVISPILDGRADAVLGSRFGGAGERRVLYFWHRVGNGMLTLLSNMLTDLNVADMETGYKAFSRDAFATMVLFNDRFGIEPEIVARLSQMGARVYEVPISYHGRTYAEGKKITWRDGVAALFHIIRARLNSRSQPRLPAPPRRESRASSAPRAPLLESSVQ